MEYFDLLLAVEEYAIEKGFGKSDTTVSELIDMLANEEE